MKIERREIIAAGGLAAFAAGFSQTLGRVVSNFTGAEEQPKIADGRHIHGRSIEPEYTVDPVSGAFTPNPNQQISYTACLGCTTQCGVRVRVDKTTGEVLRVTGNPYSPLSTEPHLPMKTSVKESLIALSRFQDQGLAGRSTACGRGNAAMDQMNSPFRVLTPMKRVGARNSGQWQPISFEQLVKEVVEGGDLFGEGHVDGLATLRDFSTPIDPEAPELGARVNQVGVLTSVNDGRENFSRRFWNQSFGTLNHVGHGSYCGGAYRSGSGALFGDLKKMPHAKPDLSNAEFVLFIGTAPGNAGNPFKIFGSKLAKGRADGRLDYVVVDPVLNNSNNLAAADRGRWVPIRPGTDGALVMGIMRWMFDNNKVNADYLAWPNLKAAHAAGEPSFTNAGWLLITQDGHPRQGRFLRGSDIGIEVASEEQYKDADPYVIATAAGELVAAGSAMVPAVLDASRVIELDGKPVTVKTPFEMLRASARRFDIAEYSALCGVPEEVIIGLADEFTRHGRKASAVAHGGMMAGNGFNNAYSVVTLNALIGNLNWKGGFIINGGGFKDNGAGPRYDLETFPGQVKPRGTPIGRNVAYEKSAEFKRRQAEGEPYPATDAWFPNAPGLGTEWFTGALRGYPYTLKALVLWSCNPIYGIPGIRPLIEKGLADPKQLPLIIAVDPLINESNAFADYIVPDSIMYESWGFPAPWAGIPTQATTARWPVVEPKAEQTADGVRIGMETFYIALAKAMGLPGFGAEAIADMEGKRYPLERAEDWYLRGAANVAFAGKAAVGDASDEDMSLTGVDRIRGLMESTLKPEEWRKVATVYTRGGRYQAAGEAQDATNPEWQTKRFTKPLWLWNENIGTARNTLTGARRSGCATWAPPAFFDGTPMRELHPEADWPLQVVSFKSALQNSYSIATRITGLHPDNPVIVHPADAARAGLQSGDSARIQTPGGEAACTVIVHEGVMEGVMAIEHGYGHRELGARAHRIGEHTQPQRPDLRAGINLNDLGLYDPTRGGAVIWVDSVSGTAVRQGLPARLVAA
ncbi:tetrathionate reductase [Thauera terpenica 58Eu]|uniref:Tetrathionate reductase n=1 Tax=Thauera terpenica 58Eu TaxID=1348657 RepID=T0AS99_9RHOO|nr:molybdopterin dinucleotide binding domain-containing protein [Thauera terpenica]EPZ15719.1 tetrathionate reductase [Thauera terpenica 58Eu]